MEKPKAYTPICAVFTQLQLLEGVGTCLAEMGSIQLTPERCKPRLDFVHVPPKRVVGKHPAISVDW